MQNTEETPDYSLLIAKPSDAKEIVDFLNAVGKQTASIRNSTRSVQPNLC